MLNHALPATIRERLLSEAVRERVIAARAVPAIEDLLRHGLSFEQALVGTGLISTDVFIEWMKAASGLPLLVPKLEERALPPGLERDTLLAWQVVPRMVAKNRWMIGLANPWDTDIRSALEALAVEHGWSLDFAYVLPSAADRWMRSWNAAMRPVDPLARYARALVERVNREGAVSLAQHGAATHPTKKTTAVPAAWLPALALRFARRGTDARIQTRHHRHHHHAALELTKLRPPQTIPQDTEHPVRDWTEAFQTYFEQGKMVFVLDTQGDLLNAWSELHAPHETADWRQGKRWLVTSEQGQQEELFHLALAGYPGTVCFQSRTELDAWEKAAEKAELEYAACIGHPTDHGIAWSLYTV